MWWLWLWRHIRQTIMNSLGKTAQDRSSDWEHRRRRFKRRCEFADWWFSCLYSSRTSCRWSWRLGHSSWRNLLAFSGSVLLRPAYSFIEESTRRLLGQLLRGFSRHHRFSPFLTVFTVFPSFSTLFHRFSYLLSLFHRFHSFSPFFTVIHQCS